MCGIAGWVTSADISEPSHTLQSMITSIQHRGPDGQGQAFARTRDGAYSVALGHCRLSIIDLDFGAQPMVIDQGQFTISFNGEIYNFRELRQELSGLGHQFTTNSDTEVILAAYKQYGNKCVEKFRGMFAFAIWDAVKEELFLARDQFGKKNIYLYDDGHRLFFASEAKAILEAPIERPRLDQNSVSDYLVLRYVPGPYTLFDTISKLPPGSHLTWRRGKKEVVRYFVPEDIAAPARLAASADTPAAFMNALDEAVQLRMISDVPIGAFLSGGLDSSAVVALMSRHSTAPVKTFSVGFSEDTYSEAGYARQVAKLFKTDHRELVISADDIMTCLPSLVRFRDAPVSESSDIPIFLLARAAAEDVKVVLTGEGADEILAGYPKHRFEKWAALYGRCVPGGVHRGLVSPLIDALPYSFRRVKIAARAFAEPDFARRTDQWFGALTDQTRRSLLRFERDRETNPYPYSADSKQSAVRRLLFFDQTSWLPDNLLERGDRMTMAASLEARMPFLDTELASFASRMPEEWRLRGKVQKRVLRAAMSDILPGNILSRPKVGFRVPINEWFRGPMKDYIYDHLTSAASQTAVLYDRQVLENILDEHVSGRQNHEKAIWSLLNLELFQQEYHLSL